MLTHHKDEEDNDAFNPKDATQTGTSFWDQCCWLEDQHALLPDTTSPRLDSVGQNAITDEWLVESDVDTTTAVKKKRPRCELDGCDNDDEANESAAVASALGIGRTSYFV
jgi:hypothetical protein